eukprot:2333056-Pyramimonas_sp.AAC.1
MNTRRVAAAPDGFSDEASPVIGSNPWNMLSRPLRLGSNPWNNITSFYGSSCANNGKGGLNTPEFQPLEYIHPCCALLRGCWRGLGASEAMGELPLPLHTAPPRHRLAPAQRAGAGGV